VIDEIINEIINEINNGNYSRVHLIENCLIRENSFSNKDFEEVKSAEFNYLIAGVGGIFEKYGMDNSEFRLCFGNIHQLRILEPDILREKKEFYGVRDSDC